MVRRYQHSIFARQYDLSEGDASHLGDREWYASHLAGIGGPLLEIGAGTGRVTRTLVAAGASVIALDLGVPMLRILGEHLSARGLACVRVAGDCRRLPFRGGSAASAEPMSGAFSAYNSLGCLLDRASLAAAFTEIRRVLRPGAPLLFDVADHRPGDLSTEPRTFDWETWTHEDGTCIRRRTTLRHDERAECIRLRYDFRWLDAGGNSGDEKVAFALNTWSPSVYVDSLRAAGFAVLGVEDRTLEGRQGRERMWAFVRASA